MSEATEVPEIVERVRKHIAAAVWSIPDEEKYIDFLTKILAALTAAIQRAEWAEARRHVWEQRARMGVRERRALRVERDTMKQRAEAAEASLAVAWASMETMQSVIDTLIAERDALRKDAAAISSTMKDAAWLLLHASRQGVNEHRAMVEASCNLTEHIERITAAMAVQPTTSTGDPT